MLFCFVYVAFVVVGDGPMKKSYINTARKEDVSDKLFFVDSVPYTDLASFSKSADIGVTVIQPISKSYENALPNKLFEYAVSGLPVICSNLVAMKEMVSIYKCGISIPPTDLNAFIEAFNTINKNENNFKIGINLQKELLWENQNKQLIEFPLGGKPSEIYQLSKLAESFTKLTVTSIVSVRDQL